MSRHTPRGFGREDTNRPEPHDPPGRRAADLPPPEQQHRRLLRHNSPGDFLLRSRWFCIEIRPPFSTWRVCKGKFFWWRIFPAFSSPPSPPHFPFYPLFIVAAMTTADSYIVFYEVRKKHIFIIILSITIIKFWIINNKIIYKHEKYM